MVLALISFLIVILFSLIIVKIGAIALEATGLSEDVSTFQSQSAFSGVGFTTDEAEMIMTHPMRRKILAFMMLMGSAGLTSAIATLILTFIRSPEDITVLGFSVDSAAFNIGTILIVLIILFVISKTKRFDAFIRWILQKPLHLFKKQVALYDYERVLGLSRGYTIGTFEVPPHHWMSKKTIKQLETDKEGLMILGVYRENKEGVQDYLGIPSADFTIHRKDRIMAYGKDEVIANFATRPKGAEGTAARKEAVEMHKKYEILQKIHEKKFMKKAVETSNNAPNKTARRRKQKR